MRLDGTIGVREERTLTRIFYAGICRCLQALYHRDLKVLLPGSRSASRWCTRQSVGESDVSRHGWVCGVALASPFLSHRATWALFLDFRTVNISAAEAAEASAAMRLRSRLHRPST